MNELKSKEQELPNKKEGATTSYASKFSRYGLFIGIAVMAVITTTTDGGVINAGIIGAVCAGGGSFLGGIIGSIIDGDTKENHYAMQENVISAEDRVKKMFEEESDQ